MVETDIAKTKPYGFVIYRGDHSDDAMWDRYMAYLKQMTHQNLESEGKLELWNHMDWKVMTSPELNGNDGGPDLVRRLFNEWIESREEEYEEDNYRYRACIYVNHACLEVHESFMRNKSLDAENQLELRDIYGGTMACLVSKFEEEGWVLVTPGLLMPRAGETIMDNDTECCGWAEVYRDEGTISVDF